MKWSRAKFDTRAVRGPIHRHGYTCGSFGLAKDREWVLYHLPTGMEFLYSYWDTAREAKRFAESLLGKGDWNSKTLNRRAIAFHQVCHGVAEELGIKRRHMVSLL